MPALSALPERALRRLAERAGIASTWTDAFGAPHTVAPDTLRALLGALGIEQASALDRESAATLPPLLPVDAAAPQLTHLPPALRRLRRARVLLELGGARDVALKPEGDGLRIDAALPPGYHMLELGGAHTTLAAAPARCFGVRGALGAASAQVWGVAAQLYALRPSTDRGLGDFAAAAELARAAAPFGAAALALSPVHAMFAARPEKYSPYSPSSRCWYNVLYADPAQIAAPAVLAHAERASRTAREFARLRRAPMLDWPRIAAARFALFEKLFAAFAAGACGGAAEFAAFRAAGGAPLAAHAQFEALQEDWLRTHGARQPLPARLAEAQASGSHAFAHTHGARIAFHSWLQWCAALGLAAAQHAARDAGMALGLITDLAVGVDPDGSECWTRPQTTLPGARIGAPPDPLNALGQNWGLTTFSPYALRGCGFAPWLDLLRASMRHAGGVRIDHVMSLWRLWLIPAGAEATAGAYLAYPSADLLRLLALESWRHRCIVIGEDLGTVPADCRRRLARAGVLGLDVLPFVQFADAALPAARWRRDAVAMPSTHDLPPLAGWWRGRDLAWRRRLALFGAADEKQERQARERQRAQLACAFGLRAPRAAAADVVDTALDFVARSPAPLALIPLEDLTAQVEQPNLPGTIEQHPNWRRRYAASAPRLFARARVAARARRLQRLRSGRR